jgi:predicted transcriptional regulator
VPDRLADQITIRLTTEERAAIERIAEAEQRSVAFVARQGVRRLLSDDTTAIPADSAAAA